MKAILSASIQIQELSQETLPFGTTKGKEDYRRVARKIGRAIGPIPLDMSHLKVVDTAWAREVVGRLVREAGEDRAYYLNNVSDGVEENISASLFVAGLSILARRANGRWKVIGKPVTKELEEVLKVLKELHQATARELSEKLGDLRLTACNNRLRDLRDLKLVLRVDAPPSGGGRQYAYSFLW